MKAFHRILVVLIVVVAAAVAPPAGAAQPPATMGHDPALLVIRGQPQALSYWDLIGRSPLPSGTLYVRNDTQQTFTKMALVPASDSRLGRVLTTTLPAALLRGQRVHYYAQFSGAWVDGVLTVPPGGAKSPQTAVILDRPVTVPLGEHEFGAALTPHQAVVARAEAGQVGWYEEVDNSFGPWSFKVGADGSVWLLDQVNDRLLVWAPGKPDAPARAVPVPRAAVDFALGPDAIYISTQAAGSGPTSTVYRLTSDGAVRWRTATGLGGVEARLAVGPDAVLYQVESNRWTPVTTMGGVPLPVDQQTRLTRDSAPIAGGGRLVIDLVARREYRVALLDAQGRVARAWRLPSTNDLSPGPAGLPGMVGGDPVLSYLVSKPVPPDDLSVAHVLLRLTPSGAGTQVRVKSSQWGEDLVTGFFIAADGGLYQLRTSRTAGISIVRFSLGPVAMPSPTGAAGGPVATPSPTYAGGAGGGAIASPTASAEPTAGALPEPSGGTLWWPWLLAFGFLALAGVVVGALLLRRSQRRAENTRPAGPGG